MKKIFNILNDRQCIIIEILETEFNYNNSVHFHNALMAVISRDKCCSIIINFRNVSHMDSSFLAKLLTVNRQLQQQGKSLVLAEIPENIKSIFRLAMIDNKFRIEDNTEAALKFLKKTA